MSKGNHKIDPEEENRVAPLRKWWKKELYPEIYDEIIQLIKTSERLTVLCSARVNSAVEKAILITLWTTAIPIFILWIKSIH